MRHVCRALFVAMVLCGHVMAEPTTQPADDAGGALQRYVAAEDDSYGWVKRTEADLLGGRYVELTLTSQTWQGVAWQHRLFIFKPKVVRHPEQALMMIGGGSWRSHYAKPPAEGETDLPGEATVLALLATRLESPLVVLSHVPFQPMFGDLHEDGLIAYTFDRYFETGDETWPLLLPMVKSAVRGMDAVQEFADEQWSLSIKHFIVTGASKRGWTTWLTSAVDPRVNALAPMVIDVLNMAPQMKHQLDSWGEYSSQIGDYSERGLPDKLQTPVGAALLKIVDPFSYRAAIDQPKIIMLGVNDPYWTVDALNLYWDELVGEKRILYVPNTGHGLNDMVRVTGALAILHQRAVGNLKLPDLKWQYTQAVDGVLLDLQSDVKPTAAVLWHATATKRDFRQATWRPMKMRATKTGYRYKVAAPKSGFVAVFGEAAYQIKASKKAGARSALAGTPYYLSTTMHVLSPASSKSK